MNEEAGFLSAIRQTPADETARLVYADWLDEAGGPTQAAQAEFLRVELKLAQEAPDYLQQLAQPLPSVWLALVSRPKIEGCRFRAASGCPGRWDRLTPGVNPFVRMCETCSRAVRFCENTGGALCEMLHGLAVAVSPAAVRRPLTIPAALPWSTLPARVLQPHLRQRFAPPKQPRHAHAEPAEPAPGDPLPKRRTGGRVRNRNIQREDWEERE